MLEYKNSLIFIITFVCIVLLMGSVSAADNTTNSTGLADSPWPSYQNDAHKTGQSNYTGPQTNTTKWTYGNITVYGSAVTGKNGNIHVAGDNGILYTFSSTGKLLWYYVTRSSIYGSPTIGDDGTIYFSNWANSTTYAIKSNGTLIWECITGSYNFGSSPVIGSDGTVYISSSNDKNGKLYAIDTAGKIKWAYNMGIIRGTSPVIGTDGTIYMADYNGVIYAINPDGNLKWSYTLRYSLSGVNYYVNIDYNSLSLGSDGTIYIATHNGRYISISKNEVRSYIGVLYAITNYGTYGDKKWWYDFGEALYGSPAISSNGKLYMISASGIHSLNPDGSVIWSYNTGEVSKTGLTSPAIGKDGTIYFGSGNNLYALTTDGDLKWKSLVGSVVGSPAIDSDGTSYIGTLDGIFHAFNDIAADFMVKVVKGTTLTQQFTGSTTGTPKSWQWNFGDGTTSTEQNPTHTYKKAGNYTVTLTVLLQNGTNAIRIKKITITKQDILPPTVTNNLKGGTYENTQYAKLTAKDDSNKAEIYYTIDGSNPKTSGTRKLYSDRVSINDSLNLKFAAVDPSGNWSPVYTVKYTILDVIYVRSASNYNISTINKDIQAILDTAVAGSKIVFKGQAYENLKLVINKKLEIISNVGTKITNLSGYAFLVNGPTASGTSISGFNIITNSDQGILVNNADKVTISDVQVTSTDGIAIKVNGSSNTTIKNSTLQNSQVGVYIYNSSKTLLNKSTITGNQIKGVMIDNSTNITVTNSTITNNGDNSGTVMDDGGIYVQNSDQVNIINNEITDNFMGVSTKDVSNLNIKNNVINDNFVDGIYLTGYAKNITIKANTVHRNANGVEIDYNDGENIDISGNDISYSTSRLYQIQIPSAYGMFTDGDGIKFGINYATAIGESIKHNVIVFNEFRDIDGHDEVNHGEGELPVGPNVTTYDIVSIDTKFCCKINTKPAYIDFEQIGNVFKVYFRDGETGEIIDDLPAINVTVTINNRSYQVQMVGPYATLTVPSTELVGDAIANFANNNKEITVIGLKEGEQDYTNYPYQNLEGLGFFVPVNDENTEDDDNTPPIHPVDDNIPPGGNGDDSTGGGSSDDAGSGNDQGSGSDSGSDSGSSSENGASTGFLAVGAAAAVSGASSSAAGSSGGSGSSKTVQELILNENSPWGILVVVLLVIFVAGAYYRNDIMNMIKKSKE